MQFELPDDLGAATLDVERRLSDDEYFELCASNPDVRIEREPRGEIVIMPPIPASNPATGTVKLPLS